MLKNTEIEIVLLHILKSYLWDEFSVKETSRYLSMPPICQDLTQGLFYRGDFGEGEVGNQPKLMPWWITLVIGSLGAMWLCKPWEVSRYICQVTLLVIDSLDLEVQCNVNLCLLLILHLARMPDGQAEAGYLISKFRKQVKDVWWVYMLLYLHNLVFKPKSSISILLYHSSYIFFKKKKRKGKNCTSHNVDFVGKRKR